MTGMRSLFVLAMLGAQGAVAADNEPPHDAPALRQRAEDLARAASQRFTDILAGETQQQTAQDAAPQAPADRRNGEAGSFAPVWDWLARSAKSYDDVVIAQLKHSDGWTVIVQRADETTPATSSSPPAVEPEAPQLRGWSGLMEMARDWLARANRSYRTRIVTPLREPAPGAAPSETAPVTAEEQIKREAVAGAEARRRSAEAKRTAEEDEARRKAEAAAEEAQKAAEEKRTAEEAASKRRMQEQAADAQRRADEEKRRAAVAEAERKAKAEARARLIEAAAEARRKADAEEKRLAAEAEASRKAEEAKRQAAEADAAERKAVAEAEAEAKRKAEIDAEATRRSQAAARAKEASRAEIAKVPTIPAPTAPAPAAPASPAPPPPAPAAEARRTAAPPPVPVAKEDSTVAVAPPTSEKEKPAAPSASHDATPKAREETMVAEAPPPPTAKKKVAKRLVAKSRAGKKKASAYRYKSRHAYKQRRPRRGYAHGRKRFAQPVDIVYVERRCACRCGRVFAKPHKAHRVTWRGYAPVRVYAERPYRVRPHKRRPGRLTYRHRHHYID